MMRIESPHLKVFVCVLERLSVELRSEYFRTRLADGL